LDNASERIYVEMLNCDIDWSTFDNELENLLLEHIIMAAGRGVEVKILLDGKFQRDEAMEVAGYLNGLAQSDGWDLEARIANIPGIDLVHNKGLVIDDVVVVSSVNWVRTSVFENRETGVLLHGDAGADFMATWFMRDWFGSQRADRPPRDRDDEPGARGGQYTVCGLLLILAALVVLASGLTIKRSR
jgi:hypothetical protein